MYYYYRMVSNMAATSNKSHALIY